jgi:hypothetical protein
MRIMHAWKYAAKAAHGWRGEQGEMSSLLDEKDKYRKEGWDVYI